jgi:hypothetical protein
MPVAVKVFLDPVSGSVLPAPAAAYHEALLKVAAIGESDPEFGSIPPLSLFTDWASWSRAGCRDSR